MAEKETRTDGNEWRPWEKEGITELQFYHRLQLENSVVIDKLERDRDWWAAVARDYKRDLGEAMRHGPDGLAFEVISKVRWERIVEFLRLVVARGTELSELEMTICARAILLEMEEDADG